MSSKRVKAIYILQLAESGIPLVIERFTGPFWCCLQVTPASARSLCYSRGLRRLLSIAMLLIIGMPLISPLLALPANSIDGVAACCRRGGKHHCMMQRAAQTEESSGKQHRVYMAGEKCPHLPKACPATRYSQSILDATSTSVADVVLHPALAPQPMAPRRVSFSFSHQKRGPPANHI